MKNQTAVILVCVLAIAGFTGLYFYNAAKKIPIRYLPYYGKMKSAAGDSVYHTVPDFEFTNQDGKKISKQSVKGKIFVTDYFFTTCGSICPVMKKQMHRVYKYFENDADIAFLSHTVDPEHDTVEVLREFFQQFYAKADKWFFVTGNKKALYDMARSGYLLDDGKGDGGHDDFIHTQNFALIDKEYHIRGYYDGTDSVEINRLIKEIDLLKQEYNELK